ncbi:PhzF family phenazine biosynthesis protein [Streptomyces sp. NPDC047002]|uniref:PhzF family phenazine biosynthesis protein n=1 Tax=Streptomyces sp. NPDC047002 TaxID=3155475 RepID=UPI003456EFC4
MRIRIVDAFAERPFAGNPAGVLLLGSAGFPADPWLRQVAAEVNLSETAFAHPLPPGGGADWALRWFTPGAEVALCGHATLATAHVLCSTGLAEGTVRFRTLSGVLAADAHADGRITLDFPTSELTPLPVPEGAEEALGAAPVSVHATSERLGDLLVELADERTVRELTPDVGALRRLSERGVVVTAAAARPDEGYAYVSRTFYPNIGLVEDPVTGSAHTALAPFWSARLGRETLTGFQASARGGRVVTSLRGDRTLLTGTAVTVIDGELLAGPPAG